jgi:hypothetical protein
MPRLPRLPHALAFGSCVVFCAQTARATPDMERARALDQQGVRAYKEERFNDAIRFFDEAYRVGGPPSELWNVAKCRLRLDDPEGAAKEIEKYLSQSGLSANDRAEAEQQLHEIEHRPSTLAVDSTPGGSNVFIDGRRNAPAGTTPATIPIAPGSHTVTIEHAGYESYEKSVDAKYGRSIIVDAQLSRGDAPLAATTATATPEKTKPGAHGEPHRVILEGELGAQFPRFGSIGGGANVAGFFSLSYVVVDASRLIVSVGARGMLSSDSWGNTVGAPSTSPNCGAAIPTNEAATAVSAFVVGGVAWRATPRWRIGGDLGLGFATYSVGEVGGDLFIPNCRPSPGVKPAVHLGGEVSYAFSRELRLVLSPVILEAQPAFAGARSTPKDASGVWLRYGMAAGLAFDLF